MIRTQISFDEQLYRRARAEAKRLGVSLAELCRRSLVRMLGREPSKKEWMKHAGTLCSGDANASTSVDVVVYGRDEP